MLFRPSVPWCFPVREPLFEPCQAATVEAAGATAAILGKSSQNRHLRAAAPAADPGNKTEELSFQPQGQQDGQDDRMLNLAPWDLSSPRKKSDLYAGKAAAKEILH